MPPGTVALMVPCVNDLLLPNAARATVAVLERLGFEVAFPAGQTCCGQPFTNTGYFDEALPLIRNYVAAFEGFDHVVAPSSSCVGSVRHQHARVATACGEPALAQEAADLARRTLDLSEFITQVAGVTDVGASFPHTVTYHSSCHSLRVARVGSAPLDLLRAVRGLTLIDLPQADQCCGFGGTFSVKNPDVSRSMAADKAHRVETTGAEYLVSTDSMCLLNIGGVLARQRLRATPISLAEVLASTEAP